MIDNLLFKVENIISRIMCFVGPFIFRPKVAPKYFSVIVRNIMLNIKLAQHAYIIAWPSKYQLSLSRLSNIFIKFVLQYH